MPTSSSASVVVIGGGPAGLMAATQAAQSGCRVAVFDAMPSLGRKFLLAGKGGLNLTHSEPTPQFLDRYGAARPRFQRWLEAFSPQDLRGFAAELGVETFVGTSGRVFPAAFKAAPLLRAWIKSLRARDVRFHVRHRWTGWNADHSLGFATPDGPVSVRAAAVVLALGGASWPRLGSDGGWVPLLTARGVATAPLVPANCGFTVAWSPAMARQFGAPVKNVALSFAGRTVKGEIMLTEYGVEGGAVYAMSAALRDSLAAEGRAVPTVDLKPDLTPEALAVRLAHPRGAASLSTFLKKTVNLSGAAIALLREGATAADLATPAALARRIKAVELALISPRPLAEAISTAGGIRLDGLDENLMLTALPGTFAAGEMLDWEAPTGGYLLQGCFSTGVCAGRGAAAWVAP